jgi:alkanesulfonate monooxygenase SsuD/methylene tetrahydromethanopterin reductase-like flavin-dependent oxidoreductase (luciferase family)
MGRGRVPRRERGRRTDAALRVLPGLIAGQPTRLDDQPDGPAVQLAPPAAVPPILVGGMSDAALARAAEHGDGWFAMAAGGLAESTARLAELAAARNRSMPQVTASMLTALRGDPALPDEHTLTRQLADADGPFGIPAEYVRDMLVTGTTDDVAAHLADAARGGAGRVVVTFAGGDWHRQAELLADARALLGLTTPATSDRV